MHIPRVRNPSLIKSEFDENYPVANPAPPLLEDQRPIFADFYCKMAKIYLFLENSGQLRTPLNPTLITGKSENNWKA